MQNSTPSTRTPHPCTRHLMANPCTNPRPPTMSCHGHLHAADHSHVPPVPTSQAQNLHLKIQHSHVTALNMENPPSDLPELFRSPEHRYDLNPVISSDADEQIIIHVPFLSGAVKLYSVILRTNGDRYCPRTIKVWKNASDIDFDSVDDRTPHFVATHPLVGVAYHEPGTLPARLELETGFVEHHLPRHVFTGVSAVTLYVQDIHGSEEQCQLHLVEFRGEFTELSREPVVALYEAAARPTDHPVEQSTVRMGL